MFHVLFLFFYSSIFFSIFFLFFSFLFFFFSFFFLFFLFFCFPVSLFLCFSVSLFLLVSLSPCLLVSLSPCLLVSLSPCLLVSLSPSLPLIFSFSPSLFFYLFFLSFFLLLFPFSFSLLDIMHNCLITRVHTTTLLWHSTSTSWRSDLMLPSSCLDGSVTPVGPGQHPQYTAACLRGEAVGGSQPHKSPRNFCALQHGSGAQQLIRSAALSQPSLQNQQQRLEQQADDIASGNPTACCTESGWQTNPSTPSVSRRVRRAGSPCTRTTTRKRSRSPTVRP